MGDDGYVFRLGPRLVVGPGSSARAGELAHGLGLRRVLLVSDPGLAATPHLAVLRRTLTVAGLEHTLYADTQANPTTRDVAACLALARDFAPDGVVALGGGSSMDTAKAANLLYTNGGAVADYLGRSVVQNPLLPSILIPTTAGTGSEMQAFALIADAETHMKMAVGTDSALAAIAILDPNLTLSIPPAITASAGIDALTHALECAVTRVRTPLSSLMAQAAFQRLHPALPRVLAAPTDRDARADMLLGAALAGAAIENSMLGAAHACANPLTARFGLVHGMAVAAMLPAVLYYNRQDPDTAAAYAALARAAALAPPQAPDADACDALAARLDVICAAAGVAAAFAACQPDPARIPALAADAATQWTGTFNPRPVDATILADLYRRAFAQWLPA